MEGRLEHFYIGAGVGCGKTCLTSFDEALMRAGVGNYNLLRVSSILPAGCIEVKRVSLTEGNPLYIAYASITSNIPNDYIAAAISVGIPDDDTKVGVIMEFSAHCRKKDAITAAEAMVLEAMGKRKSRVKQILTQACETISNGECYSTAFSGIAMW